MITMGTISIFQLDFSGTRFACSRSFAGGYIMRAGEFTVPMTPAVAEALAQGGRFIRWRAQAAARSGREMKAGATFRRGLLSVDGRTAHLELGVSDAGDSVYLEIGAARMTLTDQQAQTLLLLLDRLGQDVNAVHRASEPPGLDLTVAQGLRGWLWPWERDPSW
jgi:hypothetical protein